MSSTYITAEEWASLGREATGVIDVRNQVSATLRRREDLEVEVKSLKTTLREMQEAAKKSEARVRELEKWYADVCVEKTNARDAQWRDNRRFKASLAALAVVGGGIDLTIPGVLEQVAAASVCIGDALIAKLAEEKDVMHEEQAS